MGEYSQLLPIAREAVAIGRRIIRTRVPRFVTEKSERDLVTDIDLAVEDAVREFLAEETPEIGVLGEERGLSGTDDGLWWALDPVDGTTNFARGIPLCGVSLGLADRRRGVVGAIDLPFLDVGYSAVDGGGTWMGDERVRVSEIRDLSGAVVSIGDFAVGEDAEGKNRVRIALLRRLGSRVQRVRMVGTAAIDLAWVADGKLDASIILANMPWDTLAGVVLVREAGGVVLDQDGTDHTTESAATIALSPGLCEQIMTILEESHVDSSG